MEFQPGDHVYCKLGDVVRMRAVIVRLCMSFKRVRSRTKPEHIYFAPLPNPEAVVRLEDGSELSVPISKLERAEPAAPSE